MLEMTSSIMQSINTYFTRKLDTDGGHSAHYACATTPHQFNIRSKHEKKNVLKKKIFFGRFFYFLHFFVFLGKGAWVKNTQQPQNTP